MDAGLHQSLFLVHNPSLAANKSVIGKRKCTRHLEKLDLAEHHHKASGTIEQANELMSGICANRKFAKLFLGCKNLE